MSGAAPHRSLVRRRWVAVVASALVPATLVLGFEHRGTHMAGNLLLPGSGLFEDHLWVGMAFTTLAVLSTVAWVRWGMDWTVLVVIGLSILVTAFVVSSGHVEDAIPVQRGAHEFPLVLAVMSALAWIKSVTVRLPVVRAWRRRRAARFAGVDDLGRLGVVDRCRTAAIAALGSGHPELDERVVAAIERPDVERRARRISLLARGRLRQDALAVDHAPIRAALALCGRLDDTRINALVADARRRVAGVPASEPTWVRPLDATLAAVALDRAGHREAGVRWSAMLDGPMALRRGHRPAWYWTPLGIAAGSAPAWEHAASTALARSMGWIGDDDWPALRRRVLGAAARGEAVPEDARLIAAGRLWLTFVDDPQAARLLARRTISADPMACALDQFVART